MRALQCFAEGNESGWEAICLDLDIAVEGRSFDEVRTRLDCAIRSYIADASRESEADARRLMSRRAPWPVRVAHRLRYVVHGMGHRRNGDLHAGFDLPCPA